MNIKYEYSLLNLGDEQGNRGNKIIIVEVIYNLRMKR